MKYLITGATGFVGQRLLNRLKHQDVTILARKNTNITNDDKVILSDLEGLLTNSVIKEQFDTIIHLAGLAHDNKGVYTAESYFKINKDCTIELAKQSALYGMKRFVFVSSMSVYGSNIVSDVQVDENTQLEPDSEYGRSKLEAEMALMALSKELDFQLVIVRPPLIYAKDAPGNISLLVKLIKTGLPLPFGGVNNKKSFISLDNLVDFLIVCSKHHRAANENFVVADSQTVSLTSFVRYLMSQHEKANILIPFPKYLLNILLTLAGKRKVATQLLSDYRIDSSKAQSLLDWVPKPALK